MKTQQLSVPYVLVVNQTTRVVCIHFVSVEIYIYTLYSFVGGFSRIGNECYLLPLIVLIEKDCSIIP